MRNKNPQTGQLSKSVEEAKGMLPDLIKRRDSVFAQFQELNGKVNALTAYINAFSPVPNPNANPASQVATVQFGLQGLPLGFTAFPTQGVTTGIPMTSTALPAPSGAVGSRIRAP